MSLERTFKGTWREAHKGWQHSMHLQLDDKKLQEVMRRLRENTNHKRIQRAFKMGLVASAPMLKKALRREIPVKKPGKDQRGRLIAGYPRSHFNWWKFPPYQRRAGALKRSVKFLAAKMPTGLGSKHLLPRGYIKIQTFPWVFLRAGTAERFTGRRGGPRIWTGRVKEKIYLSTFYLEAGLILSNRVSSYLKRFTGVGPKLFKGIPSPTPIPKLLR